MGLRELKARRTREAIAAAALDLFERQGYDATTMEQIAEVAEVAPTTLYRYFPTKESTLTNQLNPDSGTLADYLAARPPAESLEIALGQALRQRLRVVDDNAEDVLRLGRQINLVPAARARALDALHQEQTTLEAAVARRCAVEPAELWVKVTAHTTVMVCQLALEMMRAPASPTSAEACAAEVIQTMAGGFAVLPRMPADE